MDQMPPNTTISLESLFGQHTQINCVLVAPFSHRSIVLLCSLQFRWTALVNGNLSSSLHLHFEQRFAGQHNRSGSGEAALGCTTDVCPSIRMHSAACGAHGLDMNSITIRPKRAVMRITDIDP